MFSVLGLALGFLVWSSGFVVVYALHATGCAFGWHELGQYASPLRLSLLTVWALHLAALGWLLALYRRPAEQDDTGTRFARRAAMVLTALALFATVWTGAPMAVLELCV